MYVIDLVLIAFAGEIGWIDPADFISRTARKITRTKGLKR